MSFDYANLRELARVARVFIVVVTPGRNLERAYREAHEINRATSRRTRPRDLTRDAISHNNPAYYRYYYYYYHHFMINRDGERELSIIVGVGEGINRR